MPQKKPRPKPRTRPRDHVFLAKLAARIRKVRLAKGYSIDRMALETDNLSRATISRIEAAKADPQASTLNRIAKCLGVTLPYLMDLSRER